MADEVEIRTELLGFDEFIRDVHNKIETKVAEDTQTLHEELVALMDDIKANYVPIDKGDLAASGFVSNPMVGPTETVIALGFTEPYALIQHERLDYYHPHGQAKYLEQPLEQFYEAHK